jgi:hypothetical protein
MDKLVACKCIIEERGPANIISLPLLERFGLILQPDITFSFTHHQFKFL